MFVIFWKLYPAYCKQIFFQVELSGFCYLQLITTGESALLAEAF